NPATTRGEAAFAAGRGDLRGAASGPGIADAAGPDFDAAEHDAGDDRAGWDAAASCDDLCGATGLSPGGRRRKDPAAEGPAREPAPSGERRADPLGRRPVSRDRE